MDHDWVRLGRAVKRRREELGLAQGVGGVSAATWRKVEKAIDPPYTAVKLAQIARALGWPPGTIDRILAGGDPPAGDMPGEDDLRAELAALRDRLAEVEARLGIEPHERRRSTEDEWAEFEADAERRRARRRAATAAGD